MAGVGGKNGNGGKIVLTKEQIKILENGAPHLTIDQIADELGISPSTFRNIRKEDSSIDNIYKNKRAIFLRETAEKLAALAMGTETEGNVVALIFIQKTQNNRAAAKEPDVIIESVSNESEEERAIRIKRTKRFMKWEKENPED